MQKRSTGSMSDSPTWRFIGSPDPANIWYVWTLPGIPSQSSRPQVNLAGGKLVQTAHVPEP